jgi:hypothetical protein
MTFKLLTSAEERWRRVNSPHLIATVLAGIPFRDGQPTAPKGESQPPPDAPEIRNRAAA